ncbi:MAG: hypothetical protein KUG55_08245 [Cycloclasticus sp.]|jgi:hypothetical protein|nr:hypothetical protein [Cycloclasticus sp.]MDF1690330.1 hypothetical protein [Cycloclasticus sp.]MEE4291288.1 hypothetical protein [Cycloclasticus sp.]
MSENQPDWLSPEEYQMIVGPSLKVAAELAASRGDPTLLQDLPSMLCLMHLVTSLKDYYVDEWAVMTAMSSHASLEKAAEAACMMVLTEANVGKNELGSMISSLVRAYEQILGVGITAESDTDIQRAWEAMKLSENEQFLALLEQAAKKFVIAVDSWERARHSM